MVMKFMIAASIANQRAFGFFSISCLTCRTGVTKMFVTERAAFADRKCFMWIIATGSLVGTASEHVPGPMPGNTSSQITVAVVSFGGFRESNGFTKAGRNSLLEFAKSCCQREWCAVVEEGNGISHVCSFWSDDADRNANGHGRLLLAHYNRNDTI